MFLIGEDVWRMYIDCNARSKACREKSAEAMVPKNFGRAESQ